MGSNDREFTAKIKQTFDLVAFVSETVSLRRSGKYYTGLSPFTKEKSPSFFVNPDKQTFHCYSSDQGGDLIDFVMLTRGLNFPEALAFLAHKAGIPMETSNKTPEQLVRERRLEEERKLFLKLNRYAARFYQEELEGSGGAAARDYVLRRGIQREYQLSFALGYAPDSWTALRDYFLKIKAPLLKAHELGLFRTKSGESPKADGSNFFDTFRNRLIFPIRDSGGEVLGFGGRWLGTAGSDAPKYLNSPESVVYEKDKVLYNLDQARKPVRDMESVVLVEGYMDCLAMVQAGFPNVVANCGTALTKTQAGILRKLSSKVICLYDSDAAGQAASERAMNLFLETEGFPLMGARLPTGKDPDDFLRERGEPGKLELTGILQNSPALLDLWIDSILAKSPSSLQGRAEALDKIAQKLAKLKDDLWIQARIQGIVSRLSLQQELVVEAIRKYKKSFASSGENSRLQAKTRPSFQKTQKTPPLLLKGKSKQIQTSGGKTEFGFDHRFLRDLLKNPGWMENLRERHAADPSAVLPYLEDPEIKAAVTEILKPLQAEEERIQNLLETFRERPLLRNIFSEVLVRPVENLPVSELEAALARLKDEGMKRKAAYLNEKIRTAQEQGDQEQSNVYFQELMELELSRRRANR